MTGLEWKKFTCSTQIRFDTRPTNLTMNCCGTACKEMLPRIDLFLNQPVELCGTEIHFAVDRKYVVRIFIGVARHNHIEESLEPTNVFKKQICAGMCGKIFQFI